MDAIENFVRSDINPIDASATTITGADIGARFPDPATEGEYNITLHNKDDYPDPSDDPNREIVRVTEKNGNTLTIIRGQENTTAQTHNEPGKQHRALLAITKKTIWGLLGQIAIKIWNGTTTYFKNDLVAFNGSIYRSEVDNQTDRPDQSKTRIADLSSGYTTKYTSAHSSYFYGGELSNDGTKLFEKKKDSYDIYVSELSTPFDFTTRGNRILHSGFSKSDFIRFSDDGLNLYLKPQGNSTIYQYKLSNRYDLSTANYHGSKTTGGSYGFWVSDDGVWISTVTRDSTDSVIGIYKMATPHDITTASFVRSTTNYTQNNYVHDIVWSPNGKYVVLLYGYSDTYAIEYEVANEYDISSVIRTVKQVTYSTAESYGTLIAKGKLIGYSAWGNSNYYSKVYNNGLDYEWQKITN